MSPIILLPVDAPPFTPLSVTSSTLRAWYDFSDVSTMFTDQGRTTPVSVNDDPLRGVTDLSGNGYHLIDVNTTPLYKVAGIHNTNSVMHCNGTDSGLEGNVVNSGLPVTVIVVAKSRTSTPSGTFGTVLIGHKNGAFRTVTMALGLNPPAAFEYSATTGGTFQSSILSAWASFTGTWHIHVYESNGASSNTWVENTADLTGFASGVNGWYDNGLRLGVQNSSAAPAGWDGQIGEAVVFDSNVLSTADRVNLVNGLKTKWGIA